MHTLHSWSICVWSSWFPSILPIHKSVIGLIWTNKSYFWSLFYFFSCHPSPSNGIQPRSTPHLTQITTHYKYTIYLITRYPFASITSKEGHRLWWPYEWFYMTMGLIFSLWSLQIHQKTLILTLIHPLFTIYTLPWFVCAPYGSHQYDPYLYQSVIALLWPNEWYFVSFFQFISVARW